VRSAGAGRDRRGPARQLKAALAGHAGGSENRRLR
jgi:hypothetical protein